MNSPFTDLTVPETYTDLLNPEETFESPFFDPVQTVVQKFYDEPETEIDEEQDEELYENYEFDEVGFEGELSASETTTAVKLNKETMVTLGWKDHLDKIIDLLNTVTGISAREPFTKDIKYEMLAKAVDSYQVLRKFPKPKNKGVLGIGTWSEIQNELQFLHLNPSLRIDTKKATAANLKMKSVWGKKLPKIYEYFNKLRYIEHNLPLDGKYFSLIVGKWQSENALIKDIPKEVTGIINWFSWDILETELNASFADLLVRSEVKLKDTKAAGARFVKVMGELGSKLRDKFSALQSGMDTLIINEKNPSSMGRAVFYLGTEAILDIASESKVLAIPSALGKVAIGMVKKYYEEKEENARKDANIAQSFSFIEIIATAKAATYSLTDEKVFIARFDDVIKSIRKQPGKKEKDVDAEFEKFLVYLIYLEKLKADDKRLDQIAISKVMNLYSRHTRIVIDCHNTSRRMRDWGDPDIKTIITDPARKRMNIHFTNIHPQTNAGDDLLNPVERKLLKKMWSIWTGKGYALRDLYFDKDVFLRVNFWERINASITIPVPYNVYVNTIRKEERSWTPSKDILGRENSTIRFYSKVALNSKDWKIDAMNTEGMDMANAAGKTYRDIILTIVNSVMANEYNIPKSIAAVGYLESETGLTENELQWEEAVDDMNETEYSETEFDNEEDEFVESYEQEEEAGNDLEAPTVYFENEDPPASLETDLLHDDLQTSVTKKHVIGLDSGENVNIKLNTSTADAAGKSSIRVKLVFRVANGTKIIYEENVDVPNMGPDPAKQGNVIFRKSIPLKNLGKMLSGDGVKEVATIRRVGGTSDEKFSTALTSTWQPRGQAQQSGTCGTRSDDWTVERPDAMQLLKTGGVCVIELIDSAGVLRRKRFVKNPADVFYYTGHGLGVGFSRAVGANPTMNCLAIHDGDDNPASRYGYCCWASPANLLSHWKTPMDLDAFIIAGCAVLGVDGSKATLTGDGLEWAKLLYVKGGPLLYLLGYGDLDEGEEDVDIEGNKIVGPQGSSAPDDAKGGDTIASELGKWIESQPKNLEGIIKTWLLINMSHLNKFAVGMDKDGYYWRTRRTLTAGWRLKERRSISTSRGLVNFVIEYRKIP